MKLKILLFIWILVTSFQTTHAQSDFYTKTWPHVYAYEVKALPKSALAVADSIYARARREKNMPQLIKALFYQSKFALTLQEDAELKVIQNFKKEISEQKAPLKNVLESLLAELYWQYFQENQHKFYSRTHTLKTVNEDDFRTWDAQTMFAEIHRYYQRSLKNPAVIQKADVSSINEILIEADHSKLYRPTLYDLLANNALDFYRSSKSLMPKPIHHFSLDDRAFFERFESMTLSSPDSLAPPLQVLAIYKDLLAFHKKDTVIYVNTERERLLFLKEEATIADKEKLYVDQLTKLKQQCGNHPVSALLDFDLAFLHFEKGQTYTPTTNHDNQFGKAAAVRICDIAIKNFPTSEGAEKCARLTEKIREQKLTLTTEKVIPVETPGRVLIQYANIDSLTCTIYKINDSIAERFNRNLTDSAREAYIQSIKPFMRWEAALKNLHDHQTHKTEIVIPKLKQGFYILVAQTDDALTRAYAFGTVQVTNLALIETDTPAEERFQVVNRQNGKPVENADVHFVDHDAGSYGPRLDARYRTDERGFVSIAKQRNQNWHGLQATITTPENDTAVFRYYSINSKPNYDDDEQEKYRARCFLFTDRSIYRPGQTVFFKGILIKIRSDKSSLVPGQYVEVRLEDVNGEEVGSLRVKTNSFGSIAGEFQLPANGLTGAYTLYADEDSEDSRFYDDMDGFDYSTAEINVEEYKRPTFETSFKPVTGTFRLNQTVTLTGIAKSFSGANVGKAKVKYRVKRNVHYPRWYYWYHPRNSSHEQEIAYGEVVTNEKGEYDISFEALPEETASKNARPVFHFSVTADVTDINGETRSTSTVVKVGYHSLDISINAPETIDHKTPANTIVINTHNLNDQFIPTAGQVKIFKLKSPTAVLRPRPWPAPDIHSLSEVEFKMHFPHDAYDDDTDINNWKADEVMFQSRFNTASSKEIKFKTDRTWETGSYLIEVEATDPSGEIITEKTRFKLTEPNVVIDNQLFIFEFDKPAYRAGEIVKLRVGSASPDITLTIDIERNRKINKTYVEHISNGIKEFSISTDGIQDGFAIHCSAVNFNAFVAEKKTIPIYIKREEITIETASFTDKLQPGSKESWSFVIKGKDEQKVEAELLASMYDASLDQFKSHGWTFNPFAQPYYYSSIHTTAKNCFDDEHFFTRKLRQSGIIFTPKKYYDDFDWFGFSLSGSHYANNRYLERFYYGSATPEHPSIVKMRNVKNAKQGYIYGRVVDHEGQGMPGVNVLIKNTSIGTVTDPDGYYSIPVEKDNVLIFSFIGYATAEATVGKKNTIDVQMEEDIVELSEIVVVGYGAQEKRLMTGSVSAVTVQEVADSDYVFTALQGRVDGVQITGMPGNTGFIAIRGAETDKGKTPLYVVDGVIVESSKIDKDEVASIEVLKGDAATAIYGARASNGVIIITTKTGQKKFDEEMSKLEARKDFNETAFFLPQLKTNEKGKVQFSFTSPESLTRWKLMLLAHTKDLRYQIKTMEAITQKEIMVTPNMPRFLREGDEVLLAAKIVNLTGRSKEGKVALQLTDAITGKPLDQVFNNVAKNQTFKINGKANTQVVWKVVVPQGVEVVQYKVIAKAGTFSDGEQNVLPVLPNRTLVTETMPMYIRSGETKNFSLAKLKTNTSTTLSHHQLTLVVTSNPAWLAIQSLPYLIEFPHECAEQSFARYYANTLGSYIVNHNPTIKSVFDKWNDSNTLVSNLEKNPELKSLILNETPWVRDAQSETEQKKRIAMLFDLKSIEEKNDAILEKLSNLQLYDGGFTWFPGGEHSSPYITQHIVTSFGHLKKLGIVTSNDKATPMINKAIAYLDHTIKKQYDEVLKTAANIQRNGKTKAEGASAAKAFLEQRNVYHYELQYLYMRTSFPEKQVPSDLTDAVRYYADQAFKYWQQFDLYEKGMIALICFRNNDEVKSREILQSLKENSITSDELGMYWKDNKPGWYWYESPIETQALMIEAFAEIEAHNAKLSAAEKTQTIDNLRIWLLKNKQTTQWKSTKATTEAIYALLLNGTSWLSTENQLDVTVDNKKIEPKENEPEAGTGYFKTVWRGDDVKPSMSDVTLTKKGEGISWAGMYWQYFENLDKITAAETPLQLKKKVFLVGRNDNGEFINEVSDNVAIKVGDLLRIRIELKVDRRMEFIHMKDMRAAGLEPVDVLSNYKWQDGLGYYQSTKDASTNFFFDNIDIGVYVFEYDLRVNNAGNFSNGITTIQSMYAPEFTSHSEGIRLQINK